MRQPALIIWASSLLESLLPKDIGEAVVGDLAEETLLQARTSSRRRVGWWFAWQVIASIPGLLLLSLRTLSWFKSLGVAVVAYLALRLVEPRVHLAISNLVAPPSQVQLEPISKFVRVVQARRAGGEQRSLHAVNERRSRPCNAA